jgi:aryl-alcohol dehydrogenase-like predicted oxidoreductase
MRRTTLGRTGIEVSAFCLGTMTWGSQNTEAEGHAQIDLALDHGVDFLDTAEMYPTNPVLAETVGRTEEIIGSWIAKTGRRDDIVVATKIAGPGNPQVRGGAPMTPEAVHACVDASLRRLRTDRIDLYQIHWPNRGSYHFRQNWGFDPSRQDKSRTVDDMRAVAEALREVVAAGKVRAFGLSNESAWGTMTWLRLAEEAGAPRVATVQNEYSLLCRLYDTDMGEVAHHEDVTLLAFSPLAAGILTGKYAGGSVPEGSRLSRTPGLSGRITDRVFPAVEAYQAVARRHGLDPVQMAIAFTRTRPFPVIPILGATSTDQLALALGAAEVRLSDEVLAEIAAVHRSHPMPF